MREDDVGNECVPHDREGTSALRRLAFATAPARVYKRESKAQGSGDTS